MKNTLLHLLRGKLRASTLLETITASVILMIVFIMAMDTLTRLFAYESDSKVLLVESDLGRFRKQLASRELTPAITTFTQTWGEIKVSISPYRSGLFQIELQAFSSKGKMLSCYRYLQSNP